jgi:ABC-type multidrug transport system, permease component
MRKILLIGIKDIKLVVRDRAALSFMLLAPFLLTLGLGFVTGAFNNTGSSGISQMKVIIVNQDDGQIGKALVDLFQSADLADLVAPALIADPGTAHAQLDAGDAVAAIIIPAGFSDNIIPANNQVPSGATLQVEVYKNPLSPVTAGVIQSIVEEFISRVETGRVGGQVIVTQMLAAGFITPDQVGAIALEMGQRQANAVDQAPAIALQSAQSGQPQKAFNPMAYMAPGMALMFLMYTVSNGGRSILAEQALGTLPRLLVSPTNSAQVLIGKILGVYVTGVVQMFILIEVCSALFGLQWGDSLGMQALVLAVVFAATGWGMLVTSLARTPGQVNSLGIAIMLTFAILGGSFIQLSIMPGWFQLFSKITPNAWGLDGFTILGMGGSLADLGKPLLGLAVMGSVLFAVSIFIFSRRSFAQK